MTTETELMEQAIMRDLDRYRRATDSRERLMIMDRMIDTMCDLDPEMDLVVAQAKIIDLLRASN